MIASIWEKHTVDQYCVILCNQFLMQLLQKGDFNQLDSLRNKHISNILIVMCTAHQPDILTHWMS